MRIEDAASRLEALGNPTRLRIYRALVRAGDPGLPVGRLQSRLGVPPLICRANYPVMRGLVGFLVEECCTEADCVSIRRQADTAA